jgi:hypothetical protein
MANSGQKKILNHGSLFSGIGGFDLAAEWMGWNNVFHCEWIPGKQEILKRNFPNTDSYGDIQKFNGKKYKSSIDILSGGFPCQDLSIANQSKNGGGQRVLKAKGRGYGKNMRVWLGKLDLESLSLKTAQCSLVEDSKLSFATFTSSGMIVNGDCFMLPNSDFRTAEKEFTEWPTPASSDGKILLSKVESYKKYYRNGHQDKSLYQFHLNGLTAIQAMKMYEWMMGFPKNWIKNLYMDSEMP